MKRYHAELGTTDLEILFNTLGNRFFVSRLALVEVQSSFARLFREGILTKKDFGQLVGCLEADVAAGILTVVVLSSARLAGAATLMGAFGLKHNMRTLDAIHLATAQSLQVRHRLAGFVAADKKLLATADSACGMNIVSIG